MLEELDGIRQVWKRDYDLYILEQPSSWSTSRIRPSWPRSRLRLSLLLAFHSKGISCCHASLSILVFLDRVSHLVPSLLSRWLLTNVQVNNTTTLYDTHEHTYIHHIGITILLSSFLLFFLHFFHLSWQAGWSWPFRSDTVMVTRKCIITRYITKITVSIIQKELRNIFKIKISCFCGIRKHIFLNKSHLTEQK